MRFLKVDSRKHCQILVQRFESMTHEARMSVVTTGRLNQMMKHKSHFDRFDFDLILTSHCSATRGLLATDHVILNHGQVTWMTPELAPPFPNYHTTPTGGHFSSRQI
ncbi:hypothetical protein TNCV_2689841 [Trichonephila clavipes]|uniref:Uncharacterized protein n=1 Tax=Trichonephila clavipes TaxID=2585209 RepID=A0A8X6VYH4_TRICX|nr:hypothetical protein TNCV_2689841 [Trichonephila clavipes]